MKSIVVAYDKNYGIGAENDLLWLRDLPDDLKHFKELTTGNAVIMGRRTYESIGRPLPNRQNIVITRQDMTIEGATVVDSLENAYKAVEAGKDACVIGGGEIFQMAFDETERIYATEVGASFSQASVFFPKIDLVEWQEVSRDHHETDERNKYPFDFVIYDRR